MVMPPGGRLRAKRLGRGFEHLAQAALAQRKAGRPCVVEELLDDAVDALGLATQHVEQLSQFRVVRAGRGVAGVQELPAQALRRHADGVERVAHLVRDGGRQFAHRREAVPPAQGLLGPGVLLGEDAELLAQDDEGDHHDAQRQRRGERQREAGQRPPLGPAQAVEIQAETERGTVRPRGVDGAGELEDRRRFHGELAGGEPLEGLGDGHRTKRRAGWRGRGRRRFGKRAVRDPVRAVLEHDVRDFGRTRRDVLEQVIDRRAA